MEGIGKVISLMSKEVGLSGFRKIETFAFLGVVVAPIGN